MGDPIWGPDPSSCAVRVSAYPIRCDPCRDRRFTFALVADVIEVLERRGYPRPCSGDDFVCLQRALFSFIYGTATEVR